MIIPIIFVTNRIIRFHENIPFELPKQCPYCDRQTLVFVTKRGDKIKIKCNNCGGWITPKQGEELEREIGGQIMKAITGWENVKSSDDFETLEPGGYVCKIIAVENNEDKQYLKIAYDITEGDLAGYWQRYAERKGAWRGEFYRSYKDSAAGMFKGFINAVEGSNEGYQWDWNEQTLKDKYVGLIIYDEEYVGTTGSVSTWPKVKSVKTVQDIRDGKFRVPETKKLDPEPTIIPASPLNADDMPF